MRISDWSSDVCSSDLKPHSARSVGRGSLTSGQHAEFVLTFLRKSAGNEFVSGAQPLAIPLERKRSEERPVGKACVSTSSSRWSPSHQKTKNKQRHEQHAQLVQ